MATSEIKLPEPLRIKIEARTSSYIQKANTLFELDLSELDIRFDVSGSTWGYYLRRGRHCCIRYNPLLMARFPLEGLEQTIPHEVAHYVVDQMYPNRRCKPHGREWRMVMAAFGIPNARATHQAPLDGIPVRRQQRYRYECNCGPLEVSATRHNRMERKQTVYFCKRCRQPLRRSAGVPTD